MSLFRSSLASLRAYVPTPPQKGHRLHLNEAPEDLPADFKAQIASGLAALDWSHYPEATDALVSELAEHDRWRPEGVLVGNGSNEFLQALVFATIDPGDTVVLAAPSFSLYGTQARAAGARLVEVPMRAHAGEPFQFDVDRLVAAANESRAKLILVATPNNPTGTLLPSDAVAALHDRTSALVAIDEAYRHFARQDLVPVLRDRPRLALLRTFSKSYAAAGLRLGYLLAAPELCTELHKLMMPYNLGALSTEVARELLRRDDLVETRVQSIIAERTRTEQRLAKLPSLRVEANGGANFVVVEHESFAAKDLAQALADRGVLVRDLSGYAGCGRCLRISVGLPAANDAMLAAMTELAR